MRVDRVACAGGCALIIAVSCVGQAQPQDDAALADVPHDKPRAANRPGSPRSYSGLSRAQAATPEAEAEAEPTLTTGELRQHFRDLELTVARPPTLTVGLATIYPFEAFALALAFDVYVVPRLRLSLVANPGLAPDINRKWRFSGYADAAIGLVLVSANSQTYASVPLLSKRPRRSKRSTFERLMLGEEPPPTIRAQVPSSHSLELAAGAFSGRYPLYRCTAHCDEDPVVVEHTKEDASLQTTFLYAGLRYVYYRSASSKRAPFQSVGAFESGVDALTNPFTPHDENVFDIYDEHPSYNPVGVRVTLRLPAMTCGPKGPCLGLDLMGGYLPSPAGPTFAISFLMR